MTKSEMLIAVKNNLKDDTRDLDISDVILSICDYCNLDPDCLPELLEPVIRKKVKGIIDYEAVKGTGYQQATTLKSKKAKEPSPLPWVMFKEKKELIP